MRPFALFGLITVAALPGHPAAPSPASARANVLMIAVDDLNDWIGVLGGHPQVKTPNLDRLAARGTLFANAHCQAPICGASRVSLLTGQRPGTTGFYGLEPWLRTVPSLRDLTTLPQAFKRAGYRTAITGKIYHNYPPHADRAAEFDEFGPDCNFGPLPPRKLVDTPSPMALVDWGVFPERDEQQNDHEIASWAIERLARETGAEAAPLFLAVGFGRPHVPCFASQEWFDLYPLETLRLPPHLEGDRDDTPRSSWHLHWSLPEPRLKWLREADQWHHLVRSYLASISFVDAQIGRVLDALESGPLARNTIIVLWSDHGWHLGEKDITGKNSLWERSTRVPLIFAGPGVAKGRVDTPAELLDIFPTLAELCGLPAPAQALEGLSLRAQLRDAAAPRERPAITTHNHGNHTVRTRDWRYIRYADGAEELYDMANDPNEWRNLATDPAHAVRKAELAALLPPFGLPPVAGSRGRILSREAGAPVWEGRPIRANDPIPEL